MCDESKQKGGNLLRTFVCTICGYIYEEAAGIPSAGIAPGTVWEALPGSWVCPLCGAAKSDFREKKAETEAAAPALPLDASAPGDLTSAQLAALCSNLARGCEKQYLEEESTLFRQLADYFTARIAPTEHPSAQQLLDAVQHDLNETFALCNAAASANGDRGALRALTWSEKVSRILNTILTRWDQEGAAMLENNNIYVCEVCGFIYVGENPPEQCPVCKVPSWKLKKVERR